MEGKLTKLWPFGSKKKDAEAVAAATVKDVESESAPVLVSEPKVTQFAQDSIPLDDVVEVCEAPAVVVEDQEGERATVETQPTPADIDTHVAAIDAKASTLRDGNVDVETAPALMEGWLVKLGGSGLSRNWRRRWFRLQPPYLFYYRQPTDAEPAGSVLLSDFTHIEADPLFTKKSSFCWKLSAKQRISAPVVEGPVEGVDPVIITPTAPSAPASILNAPLSDAVEGTVAVEPSVGHVVDGSRDVVPVMETEEKASLLRTVKSNSSLNGGQRTYYAYAETEAILQAWLTAIRPHLGVASSDPIVHCVNQEMERLLDEVDDMLDQHQLVEDEDTMDSDRPKLNVTDSGCVPTIFEEAGETTLASPANVTAPVESNELEIELSGQLENAPAPPPPLEFIASPPTPPGESPLSAVKPTDLDVPSSVEVAASLPGVKVSSLQTKMAELDAMMKRDFETVTKEDTLLLHDMFRMCHIMLQKEFARLSLALESNGDAVQVGR